MRVDDPKVKETADKLYEELKRAGVEVIYDDRNVSAGVMFSDADLIGAPYRVIVSPRNMKNSAVEVVARDKSFSRSIPLDGAAEEISEIINSAL